MTPTRRTVVAGAGAVALGSMLPYRVAAAEQRLRVASLKFGSLAWLLETIKAEKIDAEVGLNLDIMDVATSAAGPVALLSRDADVIVGGWPWAMRQRAEGEPFQFAPYSSALGAVMVAAHGGINKLEDLDGKRLGVAGSSIDKSWILFRAYSRKKLGRDIADMVTPLYGAPPLLNEQLRQGRIDAVLNFWTFAARLKGTGFRELVAVADVLTELGIEPVPPLVGFVWNASVEEKKPEQFKAFLEAVARGNEVLAQSDDAWERIKDRMRAKTEDEFKALKAYYRSGIPKPWSLAQTQSAEKLFNLFIELGQRELVGANTTFDAKLFHGAA